MVPLSPRKSFSTSLEEAGKCARVRFLVGPIREICTRCVVKRKCARNNTGVSVQRVVQDTRAQDKSIVREIVRVRPHQIARTFINCPVRRRTLRHSLARDNDGAFLQKNIFSLLEPPRCLLLPTLLSRCTPRRLHRVQLDNPFSLFSRVEFRYYVPDIRFILDRDVKSEEIRAQIFLQTTSN